MPHLSLSCVSIGRIIIFERHLPVHKKSIKPQSGLGYVRGGLLIISK
jgi:hypothetical protein